MRYEIDVSMMYILCVCDVTSLDIILRRLNVVVTNTYSMLTGKSVPRFTLTPASGGRDYPVMYPGTHQGRAGGRKSVPRCSLVILPSTSPLLLALSYDRAMMMWRIVREM